MGLLGSGKQWRAMELDYALALKLIDSKTTLYGSLNLITTLRDMTQDVPSLNTTNMSPFFFALAVLKRVAEI